MDGVGVGGNSIAEHGLHHRKMSSKLGTTRKISLGGGRHRDSSFATEKLFQSHHHGSYLESILNKFSGEPEDLFVINNWKKWCKEEAILRNAPDRMTNDEAVTSFANALMEQFTNESKPYLKIVGEKFDQNGRNRLMESKIKFEDQQLMNLYATARSGCLDSGLTCDSGGWSSKNTSSGSEDEEINTEDDGKSNPLVSTPQPRFPSVSCLSQANRGGLFEEPYSSKQETPRRVTKGSKENQQLTPNRSRPIKKVNGGSKLSLSRKRQSYEDFNPLPVKVVPRTKRPLVSHSETQGPRSPFSSIEEEHECSFFETSVCEKETVWDDQRRIDSPVCGDVIYENATPPPSSPLCLSAYSKDLDVSETSFNNNSRDPSVYATDKLSKADSKIPRLIKTEDPTTAKSNQVGSKNITESRGSAYNRPKISLKGTNSWSLPSSKPVTINENSQDFELPDIDDDFNAPTEQEKENYPLNLDEINFKYPKPPSGPCLTVEMFEEIHKVLQKSPKEKIVSGFSLTILQEDLAIFDTDTEWLIDLNMDFYLELIKERSKQEGYPSVYVFHSFVYTLLTGEDAGYNAVQEATGDDDIFKFDLVFFPVNLHQHWRLVVVNFHAKTLKCYDSMTHDNRGILRTIGRYLRSEYRRKHLLTPEENAENENCQDTDPVVGSESVDGRSKLYFDSKLWTCENVPSDTIPQQKNYIDCGVFCLQYAEYLSRNQAFDFDQTHIPYFRKRMLYETLTKKLMTS